MAGSSDDLIVSQCLSDKYMRNLITTLKLSFLLFPFLFILCPYLIYWCERHRVKAINFFFGVILLWFKSWKLCIIKKTIWTGFYIWIKSEACRKWFLPGGYASCWNRILRRNVWANCKTLHGFAVCLLFKVVNLLSMTKFRKCRDYNFETAFGKEYFCGIFEM